MKVLQGMNDTGIRGPSHLVRRQMLESTRGNLSLSLHRVEGLGRGMAEALQLGVDVIATAYGGNTDFCTGPLAHPVRCQEVPIPRGAYPCADGHVWGEPDLDHAAELMQQAAARRLALATITRRQRSIPAEILRCWRPIGSGFRGRPPGRAIGPGWRICGHSGRSWLGG